jgi:hypothetical protein
MRIRSRPGTAETGPLAQQPRDPPVSALRAFAAGAGWVDDAGPVRVMSVAR